MLKSTACQVARIVRMLAPPVNDRGALQVRLASLRLALHEPSLA
jgi:hypothetical protein